MAIKWPALEMEMFMESAMLGRIPIITNSVSPIPNPPMARDSSAFLLVGVGVVSNLDAVCSQFILGIQRYKERVDYFTSIFPEICV